MLKRLISCSVKIIADGFISRPAVAAFVCLLSLATLATAGSLTPPGSPSSTMNTLAEVFDSIAGSFDSSGIVADQNGSLIENLKYIEANMGSGSNSGGWTDDGTVVRLTTITDNVGIGTTTPNNRLQVAGLINFDDVNQNTALGSQALVNAASSSQSTAVGYGALQANTNSLNTAVGVFALNSNTDGGHNTANGASALQSNTVGGYNTATGYAALNSNTTAWFNTAYGANALLFNTTGESNTAIGPFALAFNTTGSFNTANGESALGNSSTGSSNTANGVSALGSNSTGSNNTANGRYALYNNTTGSFNTADGSGALLNSSGDDNVAVGASAGYSFTGSGGVFIGRSAGYFTTAFGNTAVGHQTLSTNTTGFENTALGYQALFSSDTGFYNTAMGSSALFSNIDGFYNTANGAYALFGNTSGLYNTAVGGSALQSNTTGNFNTATGALALSSNTTGGDNNANGFQALGNNTTGSGNTANGTFALTANTTGSFNIANGGYALTSNTTADSNTATGYEALRLNTTGPGNTATGYQALFSNTTGTLDTANGMQALFSNTTGDYNTANGGFALFANDIGTRNTATGYLALRSNTSGSQNTATGANALWTNTLGTNNTATGDSALAANDTGDSNTANGYSALLFNTTGSLNTAVGYQSLYLNTTGIENVAIGAEAGYNFTGTGGVFIGRGAGYSTTTGDFNSAVGYHSLFSNTTGGLNTALGYESLYSNTDGNSNTAVGMYTMRSNTSGYDNTAMGFDALVSNTDGYRNSVLGQLALQNNTTGYQNTAVGASALNFKTIGNSNTAVGYWTLGGSGVFGGGVGDKNTAVGFEALHFNYGNQNVALGADAMFTNETGNDNVAIGASSGYSTLGSGNVFIGHSAGYTDVGSNALYIENSAVASSSALIYGEFDTNYLSFGANVSVSGSLEITGNTIFNGHLLPGADDTYDLGSSTVRWRDLYLASNSLHIGEDGSEATVQYVQSGNSGLLIRPDGSYNGLFVGSDTTTGIVGIGTATPTNYLDIQIAEPGDWGVTIRNTDSGSSGEAELVLAADAGTITRLRHTSSTFTPSGFVGPDSTILMTSATNGLALGTSTTGPIIFGTQDTERVRIDAFGRLGIASTSQQAQLAVEGDVRLDGSVSVGDASFEIPGTLPGNDESALRVGRDYSATSPLTTGVGLVTYLQADDPDATGAGFIGNRTVVFSEPGSTNTLSTLTGAQINLDHESDGALSALIGSGISIDSHGAGNTYLAIGQGIALANNGTGTIANGYGLAVNTPVTGFTSARAICINSCGLDDGLIYNIYSQGNFPSYFEGNLGIGTATPLAKTDIYSGANRGLRISVDDSTPYPFIINNLTHGSTDGTGFGLWQADDGSGILSVNDPDHDNGVEVAIQPNGRVVATEYLGYIIDPADNRHAISGIANITGNASLGSQDIVAAGGNISFHATSGTTDRALAGSYVAVTDVGFSGGTINNAIGLSGGVQALGGTSITNAIAGTFGVLASGSTAMTNAYGVTISSLQLGDPYTGTVTNNYGIYINDQDGLATALNYNLYSAGAGTNYFGGNIGIGIPEPETALEIMGVASVSDNIRWGGGANMLNSDQGGSIELGGVNTNPVPGGTPFIDFHYGNGIGEDYNYRIRNAADEQLDFRVGSGVTMTLLNRRVGIGTDTPGVLLHVASTTFDGDIFRLQDSDGDCTVDPEAVTVFSCSSDRRLKDDIEDTQPILAHIMDFRVRDFTMRSSGDHQTGVIAQEVQETWPDMVSMGASGYLKVEQPNPWLVIKAIQELNGKIDSLSSQGPINLNSDAWLSSLFDRIIGRFASLLGIEFGEGRITTEQGSFQRICVGDTCITESELRALMQQGGAEPSDTPAPTPQESITPTPTPEISVEPTPESTPESTPEPTEEPTPEPTGIPVE